MFAYSAILISPFSHLIFETGGFGQLIEYFGVPYLSHKFFLNCNSLTFIILGFLMQPKTKYNSNTSSYQKESFFSKKKSQFLTLHEDSLCLQLQFYSSFRHGITTEKWNPKTIQVQAYSRVLWHIPVHSDIPSQHFNIGSTLFHRCGSTLKQR